MSTEVLNEQLQQNETLSLTAPADPMGTEISQAADLMHRYAKLTGLFFFCVNADRGEVLAKTDANCLPILPAEVRKKLPQVTEICFVENASGLLFYLVPLPCDNELKTVAVGYVLRDPGSEPTEVVMAAAEENWSKTQFKNWLSRQSHCPVEFLDNLLTMAVNQINGESREKSLQSEIDLLSDEVGNSFEEISLLHHLTHDLHTCNSSLELAESCLNRMHALIEAEGNVIWFQDKSEKRKAHFLVRGEIPFDRLEMAQLVARLEDHDWSRPFVKNDIEGTQLGIEFPGLRSLIVVPIAEGINRAGWILSTNMMGEKFFGTVEAGLLNSIATILGTYLRNLELNQQHNDLLLSFVRSLVSTLDAKDPYTRGHSERVALVARRLGMELGLPEEDLRDIYLSGLLHDIGKIGVDDRILRKPGRLTEEEMKKIQEHPIIGFEIVRKLNNLHQVLPGVRYHHENYNGKGYPDGLQGEDIPLMARILGVADGYDAMGSNRPYRECLSLEKIEDIFRRGSGEQWDAKVIQAYFNAREDILNICEQYTLSDGNLLDNEDDNFLS
ncbi:MAG: HD-GYP domain-containing protein [Planctomycetes bacterium]|nr:HD-GYP domain-containing protein [Planctomycetota bacterium]